MNFIKNIFAFGLVSALVFVHESQAFVASAGSDNVQVSVSLNKVSDREIDALIKFDISKDWHIYWKNPGDAGEETAVRWQLPNVWQAEAVNQSYPAKFMYQDLVQFGYAKPAYFEVKLKRALEDVSEYDNGATLEVKWLACKEECIPESTAFYFDLSEIEQGENSIDYLTARKSFPMPFEGEAYFEVKDNLLLIDLDGHEIDLESALFIPDQKDLIDNSARQKFGSNGKGQISIEIPLEDNDFDELSGVLLTKDRAFEIFPKKKSGLNVYNEVIENQYNVWMVILMAFLGGIILNAMPCIFPILSIKAISVVQNMKRYKKARAEAVMYFWGVIVCFMIIASILVILRAQGEYVGWGFQLQSPVFVSLMIVVFLGAGLMLLDIVRFNLPFINKLGTVSFKRQRFNAFVTGLFAVLIASPCTAPFMGIAIGYTLSQPIYVYYPVFLALSVGYALPFTLVGFFPKIVHKVLPKPGKWMRTLKMIFAVPVLFTCVWLVWVLHNQVKTPVVSDFVEWQVYDEEKIENLVENGERVLINFTAKWCIICLANDRIALSSKAFLDIVREKNIHIFKADWTNNDEEIAYALQKYQRNSIPLYIYYNGFGREYKILPQLLTANVVKRELD